MEIKRSLKIRLYPTPEQLQMFIKTGGCRRFVYNKYVEAREQFYKDNIKGRSLNKDEKNKIYKGFKYTTEKDLCKKFSFLTEVSSLHYNRLDVMLKKHILTSLRVRKENHTSKRKRMCVHSAR